MHRKRDFIQRSKNVQLNKEKQRFVYIFSRVADSVWYWPNPDPTSQDKPDPDPDPTSQDKPDPDPDTSVLKILHLFYDEF